MSVRSAADVLTDPKISRNVKVNQLHREVRVNPQKFFKIVPQTEFSYQIGKVSMPDHLRRYNGNRHEILVIIDVVSRKVFARPLQPPSDVMHMRERYNDIVTKDLAPSGATPSAITVDTRIEQAFASFSHRVSYYSVTRNEDNVTRGNRLGILDRAVRSIKLLLARYQTATQDFRWTAYLQSVIDFYNNRKHRALMTMEETVMADGSTKMKKVYWTPDQVAVGHRHHSFYLQALLNGTRKNDCLLGKSRFRVGDRVRVIISRSPRSSAPNFSDDTCTVVGTNFHSKNASESLPQSGYRYQVVCDNSDNNRAHERFKEWELVVAKQGPHRQGTSSGQWTTDIISR